LFRSGSFDSLGSSDASRMKVFVLNGPTTRFLIYTENEDGSKNLEEQILNLANGKLRLKIGLDTLRPGLVRSILGPAGNESFLINREVEGLLTGELAIYLRKKQKLTLNAAAPVISVASSTTEVRVADLDDDGANEILVRAPSGRILVLGYDEGLQNLVQLAAFSGNSAPLIVSLDGSKGPPQIITTRNDAGRLRLSVYETRTGGGGNFKI